MLHTTGGYLTWAAWTHELVFDYRPGEVFWCTADVGWVTGHSYIVYGPLANGATTLIFEGVPNYPTVSRFWEVIDKHQVEIFYTAPTALRALMREGDEPVTRTSRKSLRLLGTVGEPINPEAWLWYHRVVGEGRCPIVDTWWQTETGGIPDLAAAGRDGAEARLGHQAAAGREAAAGRRRGPGARGRDRAAICASSTAGRARCAPSIGDHERFITTYFTTYPGKYFTGDGCRRDEDGYYWITGRVDDVINVSGHRLGTAEIESALVAHQPWRRRRWSASRTTSRARASTPTSPSRPSQEPTDDFASGADQMGAPGDRPVRHARRDPVGAGPAQDPVGQDHAPHPAQSGRGRYRQSR